MFGSRSFEKTSKTLAGVLLLSTAGLFAAPAATAPLTAEDRDRLLDHLERTREMFLEEVSDLSPAQWQFKAAEDRWSIAECAEHIAKSEKLIRERVVGILETPATVEQLALTAGKSEKVLPLIVDRSQKFQAPEGLRPTEEAGNPEEIVKSFKKERKATTRLAKKGWDLRAYAGPHPAFEMLDAYDWLIFLSGHTERHTLQIQEVKEDPAFPKA